eukprot:EG_transcript_9140
MLPLNLPSGQLADRIGRKPLIVAGMTGMAAGDLLTASCPQLLGTPAVMIAALFAGRVLLGMGRSVAEAAERAFVADLCDKVPAVRARVLAAQQAVAGAGLVLGPSLGAAMTEVVGVGAPFYCVAAAAAFAAVVYAVLLPETLDVSKRSGGGRFGTTAGDVELPTEFDRGFPDALEVIGKQGPEASTLHRTSPRNSGIPVANVKAIFQSPAQRAVLAATVANSLGLVSKITVVPMLLRGARFHASGQEVATTFSVVALVGLLGAQVGGWLADRGLGCERVVAVACGLCAVGLLLTSPATSTNSFLAALLVWGVGVGMLGPAVNAMAQRLSPEGQAGASLAVPKTASDLAFLVGPIALGALADATDPQAALLFSAAVAAVAAVAAAMVAAVRPAEK